MIGKDKAATVKTREQYYQAISGMVRQHRGRVVVSPGGNLHHKLARPTIRLDLLDQNMRTRAVKSPERGGQYAKPEGQL